MAHESVIILKNVRCFFKMENISYSFSDNLTIWFFGLKIGFACENPSLLLTVLVMVLFFSFVAAIGLKTFSSL